VSTPAIDGAVPRWIARHTPAPDPLRGDPTSPEVIAAATAVRFPGLVGPAPLPRTAHSPVSSDPRRAA
jgi:hypothetical protein